MRQVADLYLQESKPQEEVQTAHEWLSDYLTQAKEATDLLLTGPATNLNHALQLQSHLAEKVGKVFWMAGAVDVDGNVRAT